ncbi:MAG: NERD domain-containing protein [Vicinamibacteria bacterium]
MIPDKPGETASSRAELRLFDHLRDDVGEEFVAFHHVAWLLPGPKGRPEQGEADFIVGHRELGLAVIEVKGGAIRFDAVRGEWWSRGKGGEFRIKDPFDQARQASHSLRRALERGKRVSDNRFFVGYGVALPDTRVRSARLKLDAPREIVLDGDDLRALEPGLRRLHAYWRGRESQPKLSKDDLGRLEDVLANSFELKAPLSVEYAEEERELLRLTEEQYYVLDMLDRHSRAAIAGCAGSGKTFLAAEKARRLADLGFRVLVLGFNTFLSQHLRRGLADVDAIDVFSFDGLCYEIVREAGLDFPEHPHPGEEKTYYRELRQAFANNIEVAGGAYGAVVVDEAQDFHEEWWLPLQMLLEDPDRSPLYVFYDDNQRIFPVPKGLPLYGEPFPLTRNCRNTKTINNLVTAFYKGETIEALGPEGPPIDVHFYTTDKELLAELDGNVRRWMTEAEVKPDQIALLTPKSAQRSALWSVDAIGGKKLTDDPWEPGKILRSSIYRFKGLERLVVAVVELEGVREDVLYVGFSRPNVFLSIFAPESERHRLPRELIGRSVS